MSYILGGNGRYESAGMAIRMARHESMDNLKIRSPSGLVDKDYKEALR